MTALLITGLQVGWAQTSWVIDKSHSKIGFNVTHLVISEVEGSFKEYDASVTSTSDDFDGAKVAFSAQVASIDTDNEKRDEHLRSADFFDAAQYPELKFEGNLIKKGSTYTLPGKLTIHGTTRDITLKVKYNGTIQDPWGNTKAGFKLTGDINRKEYGLKWGALTEAGGAVVSDEVEIICHVELQKQSE